MNEQTQARVPVWFRLASVIALLWTLFGIVTYLSHVGLISMAPATEAQQAFESRIPWWITAAYAVAVFVGAAGALGLVLRQAWALPLVLLSAVAVLIQELWTLLFSDAAAVYGAFGVVMPLIIITASLLIVWLARMGTAKNWLR